MKKAVAIISIVIAVMVLICGFFMIINGSLEMYPTPEQIEKVHIAGWSMTIMGLVVIILGATSLRKRK